MFKNFLFLALIMTLTSCVHLVDHTEHQPVVSKSVQRAELIKASPYAEHWSEQEKELMIEGKVQLGMSENQVRIAWGPPRDINRSVGAWGSHEQWVYNDFGPYLYFENGVLTSRQD